jgi:hypothetical protein
MKSPLVKLKKAVSLAREFFRPSIDLSGRQVNQRAGRPMDREELLIEPKADELILTNSLQRTLARKMIHDGEKWIIWPEIQTQHDSSYRAAVAFLPNVPQRMYKVWGRGELVLVAFQFPDEPWHLEITFDGRVFLNRDAGEIQGMLQNAIVPGFGGMLPGPAGVMGAFGFVLCRPERFTRTMEVWLTYTGHAGINLTGFWCEVNFHEPRELLEANSIPLVPANRTGLALT